ncbi:MAG: YetF domain-containing protein [Bacteroidota bacterium]
MQFLQVNIPFIHDPYLSIVFRALAVYFFMIIAIRVFGKKELAQLSVIDLVFILLISNAVQNAMVGPDTSLQGGLIAAAALFAANYTLKKLLYRSQGLSSLVQGKAILLIYKGVVNEDNCQRAQITRNELCAAVREHGAAEIGDVDLAMLEVDGNISVISNEFQKRSVVPHPRKHKLKGRLIKN